MAGDAFDELRRAADATGPPGEWASLPEDGTARDRSGELTDEAAGGTSGGSADESVSETHDDKAASETAGEMGEEELRTALDEVSGVTGVKNIGDGVAAQRTCLTEGGDGV